MESVILIAAGVLLAVVISRVVRAVRARVARVRRRIHRALRPQTVARTRSPRRGRR